ncbi:cyclic nucleotide-binding domain-containing protein [Paenibacillus hemerocallicola]|uniref:Cyclic nucleotide-binding domain-containing protein n=1 Tax=Paenibacillus hemerocallicola TaxID=1172614 RepID=A0A5C4T2H1_9BACL|nr:peptidase domain-containing ABC transporter [Paenibacillus hemerocallicola]TNJ63086.1 cyclic nucleotide-binding domain-containing protein [Paenibacillus hemerocallicola]
MKLVNEYCLRFLHQIPLFDVFTTDEKQLLAGQFQPETFTMGQTIVDRDRSTDSFYIIVSGKARKIGMNTAGKETNLGLLQPGEHFGEHGLLDGEAAPPITVRASASLEVLRLGRPQFQNMVAQNPAIDNYFRQYISSDIIRTFLKNNTVLTHVDHAALRSLLDRLEVRTYEPGVCLVREGEVGDAFYILKAGSALVEIGPDAAKVNRLYPGDFFGELALLTGEPRKATIRASEPVTAFRLSKTDFDELIRKHPVILESIRRISSHYTVNAMIMVETPEEAEPTAALPNDVDAPLKSEPTAILVNKPWKTWRRRRRFPVLMQQSEMDCGPTCLTMISRYFGLNASVNRMRERCNLGAEGTSMLGLIETLESLGFAAKGLNTAGSLLKELSTPFIAHWNGNHYVVVYEVGENGLVVADPALGYIDTVSPDTFNKHWTGYVITMQPAGPLVPLDDKEMLWRRYLDYVRPSKKLLMSALGLSVTIELIFLIFPVMTQQIFDRVLDAANWPLLHMIMAAMLALVCFNTVSIAIRQTLIGRLAYAIDRSMLDSFYRQLFRLPYSYFTKRTSGDILTRVYENEKIRRLMTDHAIELLLDVLTLLVYGGLMAYYHIGLAAISFALMPLYISLYAYILPKMRRNLRRQLIAEGESQTQIVEAVHAIATVKGLSMERTIRGKLMSKLGRLFALRLEGNKLEATAKAATSGLRSLSHAALLYFGSRFVLDGQLSVGGLVAYTVLFTSFMFALEMISQRSGELSEARISMERLNDVYESTPEHPQPDKMRMLPSVQGHIRFEKVSFQYYRGGKMILQNLDLELKPGQTVALVGRSGSGKSTIANLLLKLLEPSGGAIYIDGYPLREVHAASIRKQVGVVQQETMLFRGSVRENIALSGENVAVGEIERAARLAGAHEFIEALPLGYGTMIGEGGIRLSGGQRQRIVIARALVHNPRILLFDEATSALDTESERMIQQNMDEMLQGRTTLIIAHRLSTIRHADLIVVLDQGAVVESGTHEQLFRQKGIYHHLLQQQSV